MSAPAAAPAAPAAAPAAPGGPSLITPQAPAAPVAGQGSPQTPGGAPTPPPANGTAPVVAESFWRGWITDDGKLNKDRYAHLPEELKPYRETLERIGSPEDLLKSYVNHHKLAREKTLVPPPEGAPEADVKAFDQQFRKIFGVPEKPEDYGIAKPDDIPAEMWDADFVGSMAKVFHEEALTPKQVKRLVAENNKAQQATMAKLQTADQARIDGLAQEGNKKLNAEFGRDRPKMEALALNVAKSMGIPTEEGSEFNGSADMIRLAAKYAVAIGEDKFVTGESGKNAGLTPQAELKAMVNDPTNKYHTALHTPDAARIGHPLNALYREATRRMDELAKQQAAQQKR